MRTSLAAALVVLAALVASPLAAAKHEPHPKHGHVSSGTPLPYVTPWATDFDRYSVQVALAFVPNANKRLETLTVPSGQYWRLISLRGNASFDATVGNRFVLVNLLNTDGSTIFQVGAPAVGVASGSLGITIGPQGSTFANTTSATAVQMFVQTPDVILSPGMAWQLTFTNIGAGDLWQAINAFALVEVYTENYVPAGAITTPTTTPSLQ